MDSTTTPDETIIRAIEDEGHAPPVHVISTLADIIAIDPARREAFIADLRSWLAQHDRFAATADAIAAQIGRPVEEMAPAAVMVWVDDGGTEPLGVVAVEGITSQVEGPEMRSDLLARVTELLRERGVIPPA
jgi:hypothetical protein